MGKIVLRIALGLVGVGLFVIGLVAVALPRVVAHEDFQSTLRAAAAEALGVPVEWRGLEVGLLPPRLMIESPVILASTGPSKDPALRAASIDLRLALLPILRSQIEVASLVVRDAEIVLIRTSKGLHNPLFETSSAKTSSIVDDASGRPSKSVDESREQSSSLLQLAIRHVVISNSRLIIRDTTYSPAVEWRFEDLEMKTEFELSSASIAIESAARIQLSAEAIGEIALSGSIDRRGVYELDLQLEQVIVGGLAPYLGKIGVAGVLGGHALIVGDFSRVASVEVDWLVEELILPESGIDHEGRLRLQGSWRSGEPIDLSANLDLVQGGKIRVEGTSTLDGRLDLKAWLEAFDLRAAKSFVPAGTDAALEIAGFATGTASLVGPANFPDIIEGEIHVESGLLRVSDYVVLGPFDVKLKVNHPLSSSMKGRMEVDLTAAEVDVQGQFTKRAGMVAELTTEFSRKSSGEIEFESRIKLRNLNEIILHGAIGEVSAVAISTPSFDLEGWAEVFPALESFHPSGRVSFDRLGVDFGSDALSQWRGRIRFESLGLMLSGTEKTHVLGALRGEGTGLRAEGLRAIVGGMTVGLDGGVEDLLGSRRFDFTIQSLGEVEANEVISALTTSRDTVFGKLVMAGRLHGSAGEEADFYRGLGGEIQISIGKDGGGRLRGETFIQAILDQVPLLANVARLTSGKTIDKFLAENFELIEGDFSIGQGQINARSLRLVYDGYEVNLTGPIQLPSLKIDLTGHVLLKADLVSALGGVLGASTGSRDPVRIPLARVTNTLSQPKIVMTPKTLAAIPDLLFKAVGLDTLTLGLGRFLGRVLGQAKRDRQSGNTDSDL
jgi:hypothetical protein